MRIVIIKRYQSVAERHNCHINTRTNTSRPIFMAFGLNTYSDLYKNYWLISVLCSDRKMLNVDVELQSMDTLSACKLYKVCTPIVSDCQSCVQSVCVIHCSVVVANGRESDTWEVDNILLLPSFLLSNSESTKKIINDRVNNKVTVIFMCVLFKISVKCDP